MSGDRIYIDLDSIMARIRERITERGAVGIRGIGRLFRIADDDGSKSLDLYTELPKLLGDMGVLMNKTEIAELGRMLDRNGDGRITYDEFIYHFAPPMNRFRKQHMITNRIRMPQMGRPEDSSRLAPWMARTMPRLDQSK